MTLSWIFFIIAAALFGLSAIGIQIGKISFTSAGFFFLTLALMGI